jgi:DNA-directed RNA polymerase II subunit RPB4
LSRECPIYTTTHTQVQEEDATKLQFGDFADGEALTLTDVQALLVHARSAPGVPPAPDNKWVPPSPEHLPPILSKEEDKS